jgi:hypothetical protein
MLPAISRPQRVTELKVTQPFFNRRFSTRLSAWRVRDASMVAADDGDRGLYLASGSIPI